MFPYGREGQIKRRLESTNGKGDRPKVCLWDISFFGNWAFKKKCKMTATTNDKVCIINIPDVHFPIKKDVGGEGIGPPSCLSRFGQKGCQSNSQPDYLIPAPVILNAPTDTYQQPCTRLQLTSLTLYYTASAKIVCTRLLLSVTSLWEPFLSWSEGVHFSW